MISARVLASLGFFFFASCLPAVAECSPPQWPILGVSESWVINNSVNCLYQIRREGAVLSDIYQGVGEDLRLLPATCTEGQIAKIVGGVWACADESSGASLPAGFIGFVDIGGCPSGYAEVSTLNGNWLQGTLAANADIGTTGGSDSLTLSHTGSAVADHTYTPAGSVSAPIFTGSVLAGHSHGVGTYATSAHAGTAVADHASHTHDYTQVLNHTHTVSVNDPGHAHTERYFPTATGGSIGYTVDTSMSGTQTNTTLTTTSATTGITASTTNPAGGVATGTTVGPSGTLTHAVTQPGDHTLSGTSSSDSAGTPAGTVSVPTFTGTAAPLPHSVTQPDSHSVNPRPPFTRVIFCKKT